MPQNETHVCTRIGDTLIDLAVLESHGLIDGPLFSKLGKRIFDKPTINEFISLGQEYWHEARVTIQNLFSLENDRVIHTALKDAFAIPAEDVEMRMPIAIGDYTDFYSSKNHAY